MKTQNMTSLKLQSKDNIRQTLHTKFYASRVKTNRIRRGRVKNALPQFQRVFKSPGKIGLKTSFCRALSVAINNFEFPLKNFDDDITVNSA